jgi:hypothetical protein
MRQTQENHKEFFKRSVSDFVELLIAETKKQSTKPKTNKSREQALKEAYIKIRGLSKDVLEDITFHIDYEINKKPLRQSLDTLTKAEEIPYAINFSTTHGIENIDEKHKKEIIVNDVIFKQEALFYAIGMLSNCLVTGHHKFETEELLHSLSNLGEIGIALSGSLVGLVEEAQMEVEDND